MRKKKKNILKLTSVALLATLMVGIGTTGAIIRHEMSLTNKIATPTVKVEIQENIGGVPQSGAKTKEVSFVNTGSAAVFLRMSYAAQWTKDGTILPNTENDDEIADIIWMSDWNRYWDDGGDGWYYYKRAIPVGGNIQNVVSSVKFPETYPDDRYNEAEYQLHFQTEVVQASDEWSVCVDAVEEVFDGMTISLPENMDEAEWSANAGDTPIIINWHKKTEGGN